MSLSISEYLVLVRSLAAEKVRYVHAGRSRFGVDCVGVGVLPLNELGIAHADVSNYSEEAFDNSLAEAIGEHLDPVPVSQIRPGDWLLFWCNRRTKKPQHVAVLVEKDSMVHAYKPLGMVVQSPIGAWGRRITHAFRIPSTMLSET